MNINRINYEDFFLLYADQELSAAEMQEVDRFVQENPDLAIELNDFLATRLTLEEVDFDKTFLYKSSEDGIRQENATEWFSKFVDEELSPKQRKSVEEYVLQHPEQQATFLEWQQTKLPQETISCPRKTDLYKKSTPLVVVMVKRYWSAAAILLIFLGLYLTTKMDINNPISEPVAQQTKKSESKEVVLKDENTTIPTVENSTAKVNQSKSAIKSLRETNSIEKTATGINTTITKEEKQEEIIASNETESNYSSKSNFNTTLNTVSSVEPKTLQVISAKNDETNVGTNYTYKTLEIEDDEKSMYVGPLEINKDKLRGFVRKAGGLFRSKMKNEGEEVLNSITSIAQPTLK